MTISKNVWKSKTMWGAFITTVAFLLQMTGVATIAVEDKKAIVDVVLQFIEAGGILFTIYGRSVAKEKLSLKG